MILNNYKVVRRGMRSNSVQVTLPALPTLDVRIMMLRLLLKKEDGHIIKGKVIDVAIQEESGKI